MLNKKAESIYFDYCEEFYLLLRSSKTNPIDKEAKTVDTLSENKLTRFIIYINKNQLIHLNMTKS